MHELAEQAGIELPGVLGKVGGNRLADTTTEPKPTEETVDAVESD